eukprot:656785_1
MHHIIKLNIILSGFSAFRLFMYIFNTQMVTKRKINDKDWNNPKVKELSYQWTSSLRLWLLSRLGAYASVILAADETTNRYLFWANLGVDLFILFDMINKRGLSGTVINYERIKLPICIQSALVFSSLACALYDHHYQ